MTLKQGTMSRSPFMISRQALVLDTGLLLNYFICSILYFPFPFCPFRIFIWFLHICSLVLAMSNGQNETPFAHKLSSHFINICQVLVFQIHLIIFDLIVQESWSTKLSGCDYRRNLCFEWKIAPIFGSSGVCYWWRSFWLSQTSSKRYTTSWTRTRGDYSTNFWNGTRTKL